MVEQLDDSWKRTLEGEFAKEYFAALERFVAGAYASGEVYPPRERIFAAFSRTPFDRVKVVILGQDPYHEPGQAQGNQRVRAY
jgi:uracil-DNA glycosylase